MMFVLVYQVCEQCFHYVYLDISMSNYGRVINTQGCKLPGRHYDIVEKHSRDGSFCAWA